MTYYLAIEPMQEPTDLDMDDSGRQRYAFNVMARMRPSAELLDELVSVLVTAGVGVENTSIFASTRAVLPDTGNVLLLKATGGAAPEGTHNGGAGAYRRPTVQVIAHGETDRAAYAMAQAAYSALIAVRNQVVA